MSNTNTNTLSDDISHLRAALERADWSVEAGTVETEWQEAAACDRICRLLDALAQRGGPVASIYITEDGAREFDDWRHALPVGRTELYAAPQPATAAIPEGWALVPVEPTPEMHAAMPAYDGTEYSNPFCRDDFIAGYAALIAAAPQPAAQPAPVAAQPVAATRAAFFATRFKANELVQNNSNVDEALLNFSHDSTDDNAVELVRIVIEAVQPAPVAQPTDEQEGGSA